MSGWYYREAGFIGDNDPLAKLEKLKSMLDRGLIDQAEYDATKRRILESM